MYNVDASFQSCFVGLVWALLNMHTAMVCNQLPCRDL